MTENLTKLPVKSILRKSSLTFREHDDSDVQVERPKPTKVIVEPTKEGQQELAEEDRLRREEFELKRKMNSRQEAIKVAPEEDDLENSGDLSEPSAKA